MTIDGPIYSYAVMDTEYDPVVIVFDTAEPGSPQCQIVAGEHKWLLLSPNRLRDIALQARDADAARRKWEATLAGALYCAMTDAMTDDNTKAAKEAERRFLKALASLMACDAARAEMLTSITGGG